MHIDIDIFPFAAEKADIRTNKQIRRSALPLSSASQSGGLNRKRSAVNFSALDSNPREFIESITIKNAVQMIIAGAIADGIRRRSIR